MSKKFTISEWCIIMAAVGIILPFYISVPILFIALIGLISCNWQSIIENITAISEWLLFLVYTVVVALMNYNTLGSLLPIGVLLFLLFGLLYRQIVTKSIFRLLMKIISIGSGIISCHAIWTYFTFIKEHHFSWQYILIESSPRFRAESFFFNANYFGMYIVMAIIISLYWLTIAKKRFECVLIICILGLNAISIILTASRMLIPTVLVSVFVLLWFNYRKFAITALIIGMIGLVTIIINPSIFPRFSSLSYGFEDRIAIWQNGWEIFKFRSLTGRGAFAYLKYYYLYTNKTDMHSHQLLIDLLANYGLLGLFLFTNALVPFVRDLSVQFKRLEDKRELAVAIAMLMVVMVHGLMDVSILWVQTGFICLLVVCLPFDVSLNHE